MTGTWGLVILNKDEPNKLYCLKYGSPLLISKNENIVLVSSEQSGFNGLVNNYFVLEPNDICVISINNEKLEIKTKKKYKLKNTINIKFDLNPDPYPYWTLKEIQ